MGGSGSRTMGSPLRPMSPEKTSRWLPALGDPEVDRGRAQDVAGVEELEREVLPQVEDATIGHADHQLLHRAPRRPGCRAARLGTRLAALRQELEVLFLDVRGVGQHDGAQVAGGRRRVERARGIPG